jgi:hypothetical protein
MTSRRRWWQPPYELRLVREDAGHLVWSRHRIQRLATLSQRLEADRLPLDGARLIVHDRRTEVVLAVRSGRMAGPRVVSQAVDRVRRRLPRA